MGRAVLILAVTLLMQGCESLSVEDWDLYIYNCEIELDLDEGEITCEWLV